MELVAVDSSNIAAVGYDKASETLTIQFHTGALYQYEAVPENVYTGLLNAESVGKYFHANIRSVGYLYKRI